MERQRWRDREGEMERQRDRDGDRETEREAETDRRSERLERGRDRGKQRLIEEVRDVVRVLRKGAEIKQREEEIEEK